MWAMCAPGMVLMGTAFGVIGLFIGMGMFVVLGWGIAAVGLAGIVRELLHLRTIRRLRAVSVPVAARVATREWARIAIFDVTPIRLTCTGSAPGRFQGETYRTDWHKPGGEKCGTAHDLVTVLVDPTRPSRYHVDLSSFGVRDSRLDLRPLLIPVALVALALASVVVMTLMVGEGPAGLRARAATGTVVAEGHALGRWSFEANGCVSGAHKIFNGVSVFDRRNPDQQLTLIRDPVAGDVIDADIPGQDKDFRFFAKDCRVLSAALEPMDSVYNRVRNVEGHLDAECRAVGNALRAHVTFRLCH